MKARDCLSPEDYKTYRSVRAVAVFFLMWSLLFTFVGPSLLLEACQSERRDTVQVCVVGYLVLAGVLGLIGGYAVLRNSKRLIGLVYPIAMVNLFMVPIGTLLAVYLLARIGQYRKFVDRLNDGSKYALETMADSTSPRDAATRPP